MTTRNEIKRLKAELGDYEDYATTKAWLAVLKELTSEKTWQAVLREFHSSGLVDIRLLSDDELEAVIALYPKDPEQSAKIKALTDEQLKKCADPRTSKAEMQAILGD